MPPSQPFAKKLLHLLAIHIGTRLIRLIYRTCRWEVEGESALLTHTTQNQSAVIAGWHEDLLCGILYCQGRGYTTLASLNQDGEIVSALLDQCGWKTIRGSSSRKALSSYKTMIQTLKQPGNVLVITPDGPRGPARIAQAGGARAAMAAGAPLFTIAYHPHKCWRLKSWDKLKIAKPFTTISVRISSAWHIDKQTKDTNHLAETLTRRINTLH